MERTSGGLDLDRKNAFAWCFLTVFFHKHPQGFVLLRKFSRFVLFGCVCLDQVSFAQSGCLACFRKAPFNTFYSWQVRRKTRDIIIRRTYFLRKLSFKLPSGSFGKRLTHLPID